MNILIFSDTHGRIPLMLRTAWQFQVEHETVVDLILVTGDLGVWPDLNRLDNSTRKYCPQEPAELSFLCFDSYLEVDNSKHELYPSTYLRRAANVLDSVLMDIKAPIVFVGGNHEDYEYLQYCCDRNSALTQRSRLHDLLGGTTENCISVESSGLIWWLPSDKVISANGLTIAGLSGIDAAADERNPNRYHQAAVLTEDSATDACIQILDSVQPNVLDILLTHDGIPNAVKHGKGSSQLADVVRALNPRFHFFGHYHRSVKPNDYASPTGNFQSNVTEWRTTGVHINKLAFRKGEDVLRDQVVVNLAVESGTPSIEFIDGEWLSRIRRKNWWHVG